MRLAVNKRAAAAKPATAPHPMPLGRGSLPIVGNPILPKRNY
jgi:hypothetical protein